MRKENKLRHFSTNYDNAGCFIERTLHTRLEKSVKFNDVIQFSARVQVYRIERKKRRTSLYNHQQTNVILLALSKKTLQTKLENQTYHCKWDIGRYWLQQNTWRELE